MMPLDATGWANYSCVAAASLRGFVVLVVFVVVVLLGVFFERFGVGVTGWRLRGINLDSMGFKIFPIVMVAGVCSMTLLNFDRRELFVENSRLVETGCHLLADYRYEIPMQDVQVRYERHYRKGWHDHLIFRARGYRELAVELKGAKYIQNLQKMAPSVVGEYFLKGKPRQ